MTRRAVLIAGLAVAAQAALRGSPARTAPGEVLIFEDTFSTGLNFSLWKHEITLTGDENWCFESYGNK
jgi:hypothetical protein